LVFGARAGEAAAQDSSEFPVSSFRSSDRELETGNLKIKTVLSTAVRKRVKRTMWERVGIIRSRDSLQRAINEFDQMAAGHLSDSSRRFVTVARLVAATALWREESRGGHFRSDFPEPRDKWRIHSIQTIGQPITSAPRINFDAARAV
jgi:L-aspartate oxidase